MKDIMCESCKELEQKLDRRNEKIKRITAMIGDLKRELSYWEGKCLLAREALEEEEGEPKPPVREI